MKSLLIYIIFIVTFLTLFAFSYSDRVSGSDQYWYKAEVESSLVSGNPLQIEYNRIFEVSIENEELAYLPVHHSLYHVIVFPFAKFFGSLNGVFLSNLIVAFIGIFFIAKSAFLITKNHLFSAIVAGLVLLFPLVFWQVIQYLQEIYFFSLSSIIVFLYLKSFYAEPNSREEFFSKIAMYALCCVGIFLYPVFLLTLLCLLFFDLILDAKKTKYIVLFFFIAGLICHYLSGLLFSGLVGKVLFTNILYGEKGPSTWGGFMLNLTESFDFFYWISFRINKLFLSIIENPFAFIIFAIPVLVILLNVFLLLKNPNKKNFKILIMLLSFFLGTLVMLFLSQYNVRYMLYVFPAIVASLLYVVVQISFISKMKKCYVLGAVGLLFVAFVLCNFVFIRGNNARIFKERNLEKYYYENLTHKINAGDKFLFLGKENRILLSLMPQSIKIFFPHMENKREDVISRANKFSADKILISEEFSDYAKDLSVGYTPKGVIELYGTKYLYFEKP